MPVADPASVRARYQEDGFYLATVPFIPPDVVEEAVRGMDAIRAGVYDTGRPPAGSGWQPGDDPNRLCKIEQPQFASSGVMELLKYPALGEIAAEVTGARGVQVWWVQLLYKPPAVENVGNKTNIGIHQDRTYWQCWEEGSELFTAWIALSDVEEDCGPMKFARGSHKWGWKNEGNFFDGDLEATRGQVHVPEGEQWDEVSALLPAGSASFHHNLTFHGSGPNYSNRPRRSFAVHLRTENSRPVGGLREGLTGYIDDTDLCPVIYGSL